MKAVDLNSIYILDTVYCQFLCSLPFFQKTFKFQFEFHVN
jgi:hypothetical protein